MFSEKAKKNADACRFCWMCRHLCPIGLMTGKEANTPRAKGLLVAMAERGFPIDKDTAVTMFECLLCGSCTDNCVTGFEPPVFIREARTTAIVEDLVPKNVQKVIDRLYDFGNAFGEAQSSLNLASLPASADLLLYLGNTARYRTPEIAEAFMSLLKKAGIAFAVKENEMPSGIEHADLLGYVEEARQAAANCARSINQTGAKTLVVLDSYDAAAFKHEYKEWGIELTAEVVTATAYIADLVAQGKLAITKQEGKVTFHDGSRLARDLDEHEPSRAVIEAMGFELSEMFLNRRLSKCCGTSLFAEYSPTLATMVAQGRWADAQRTDAKMLLSSCPQSYLALSRAVPEGYVLKDLFMLLDEYTK